MRGILYSRIALDVDNERKVYMQVSKVYLITIDMLDIASNVVAFCNQKTWLTSLSPSRNGHIELLWASSCRESEFPRQSFIRGSLSCERWLVGCALSQ